MSALLHPTQDVLRILSARLIPVEQVTSLGDEVEGHQPEARSAAVLLALFEQDGRLCIPFIKRATSLRAHGGQIALPGGSVDDGDEFPVMTALREAYEEIGLEPRRAEVLGLLPPVFTVVSNFIIMPVVAFLPHGLGEIRLQSSEVAELIVAPLQELAQPGIMHTEQWTREKITRTVYFYDYGPYRIWGATGRMLNSFLELIKESGTLLA